ncbi:PREDICTED: density-regulated protein homolog [Amphimedon queenslandica]|uniref:SUI1 domain-containing protein n=1 Tax=Amphimedon queenslandica TaxID=400682 RepID=A0A1X7V274_AMPQE|nr:PREDICTED: density-regulated protein homolog [Amphimedon queenslandica]|eukprot:XP_003385869.3 PREDICTED: density-regulated protein homolog [Amphimedon queenslandica]
MGAPQPPTCGMKGVAKNMAAATDPPNDDVDQQEEESEAVSYPLQVEYCGVCGMPPEYCEYSPTTAQCHEWMKIHLPSYYSRLVEKVCEGVSGLAVSGKKQSRGGKGIKKPKKKEVTRSINISQQLRSKKKHVTVITGLRTCDIDPRKASKQFSTRFSCGSSVTGEDEVVVQGDIIDDMVSFILEQWPEVEEQSIHLGKDKKR